MMRHSKLIARTILFGCTLASYVAYSADQSSSTPPTNPVPNNTIPTNTTPNHATDEISGITKDSWLKSITPLLPEFICSGFENDPQLKKRLDDIKMTHEQCLKVIPESISKCQQQFYSSIPEQMNEENVGIWGKNLGECIGKDFAMKYLVPKAEGSS